MLPAGHASQLALELANGSFVGHRQVRQTRHRLDVLLHCVCLGPTEGVFHPLDPGRVSPRTKIRARVDVDVKRRRPPSLSQKRPILRVSQSVDDDLRGLFHACRQLVLQSPLAEAAAVSLLAERLERIPGDRVAAGTKLLRDDLAESAIAKAHAFEDSRRGGLARRDRPAQPDRDGGPELGRTPVHRRHDQIVLLRAPQGFPVPREHELADEGGGRRIQLVVGDVGFTAEAGISESAQTFHQVLQARLLPGGSPRMSWAAPG